MIGSYCYEYCGAEWTGPDRDRDGYRPVDRQAAT